MIRVLIYILLIIMTVFVVDADSNKDRGFIYGEITVKNGDIFRGPIRWGNEETFWHDLFNSTKDENEYADLISEKDLEEIKNDSVDDNGIERFFKGLFRKNRRYSPITVDHIFACRFGEIRTMKLWGTETVLLTLKNDEKIEVNGGSNDIGTDIHIFDENAGKQKLKWKNIRKIDFMPVPGELKEKFGTPLYGTVSSKAGKFSGYIQWDIQECLDTDELDGDYEDNDMSIKFGEIKSIEKYRKGSLVTLYSGKEYYLHNSNDVDDDNRGIIINDHQFGRVQLEWNEFDRVDFDKVPQSPIASYDDFIVPRKLAGTVETRNGETYNGRFVYDIDEEWDFELISGYNEQVQFLFPIRNIDLIEPSGRCCSRITLKNGKTLELENERDVNKDNDGLLLWESEDPVYIPWRKITKITFK
jgi:hypothetical protein